MLPICLVFIVSALANSPMIEGKSTFQETSDGTRIVNTAFQKTHQPAPAGTSIIKSLILKVTLTQLDNGGEKPKSELVVDALDPSAKKIWSLTENGDRFRTFQSYLSTVSLGCCGSADSYRAYGVMNGTYLFPYSFNKDGETLAIVNRYDDPAGIRLIGYQDNYWPSRDKRAAFDTPTIEGLKLAGILTYASSEKTIQKVGIFYDEKKMMDPSQDPNSIAVVRGKNRFSFPEGSGGFTSLHLPGWKPNKESDDVPEVAFNDLTLELKFENDRIELPIKKDRIDVKSAKIRGKYYKKVIELP